MKQFLRLCPECRCPIFWDPEEDKYYYTSDDPECRCRAREEEEEDEMAKTIIEKKATATI